MEELAELEEFGYLDTEIFIVVEIRPCQWKTWSTWTSKSTHRLIPQHNLLWFDQIYSKKPVHCQQKFYSIFFFQIQLHLKRKFMPPNRPYKIPKCGTNSRVFAKMLYYSLHRIFEYFLKSFCNFIQMCFHFQLTIKYNMECIS